MKSKIIAGVWMTEDPDEIYKNVDRYGLPDTPDSFYWRIHNIYTNQEAIAHTRVVLYYKGEEVSSAYKDVNDQSDHITRGQMVYGLALNVIHDALNNVAFFRDIELKYYGALHGPSPTRLEILEPRLGWEHDVVFSELGDDFNNARAFVEKFGGKLDV